MLVREAVSHRAGWSKDTFSTALASLLTERNMSLVELSRETGVEVSTIESILEGETDPIPGVIELVARAFRLAPQYFLAYRLAEVVDGLGRDAERANQLFLESLTEMERQSVDPSAFDNKGFPEAVRALLVSEEMGHDELAESMGLTQAELSRTLNRRHGTSAEVAEAAAQALGVPPEFFLAYRLALVRESLRERPDEIDGLLESLERGVELDPYESWPVREMPDPRQVALSELARSLIEIVAVEGPVLGARVYSLRLAAAGIRSESRDLRKLLNRASYVAMLGGAILGENERPERTQKYLILRLKETPEVRVRSRGDRRIPEIPLAEVRAVVETTPSYRRGGSVAGTQEEVLAAYQVFRPGLADLEHINRAINLRRGM